MSTGKRTSTTAVISLISGILGWSFMPWLGSVVAVVTGHRARAEIRNNPDTVEGDGLAIAGLVLGWLMLIYSALVIGLLVLFFGGLAAILAFVGLSAGH